MENTKKKIALIFGGTSGIGKAIIDEIIIDRKIIFTYRSNKIQSNILKKKYKENIYKEYKLDFANLHNINNFITRLKKEKITRFVDTIIFNAAEIQNRKSFFSIKLTEQARILKSNCINFFYLVQQTLKILKKNKNLNKIVFISSKSAYYGGKYISAYSSSKGFLNTFVKALVNELDKKKFRIFLFVLYKVKTKGLDKSDKNLINRLVLEPSVVAKKINQTIKKIKHKKFIFKLYK